MTAALIKANITDYINDLHGGSDGFVNEASSASTVTLSTTSDFAGLATVTATLAEQRRMKITTIATFNPNGAASARYRIQSGYNTGASASIGSVVKVGQLFLVRDDGTTTQSGSGISVGTALLAAGTYTFYGAVSRISGGAATDTAGTFYTLVEDIGAV